MSTFKTTRNSLQRVVLFTGLLTGTSLVAQEIEVAMELPNPTEQIAQSLTQAYFIQGTTPQTYSLYDRMEDLKVVGITYAVAIDGRLIVRDGLGTVEENSRKRTHNHLFQAASISKPITGIGVLKLVEEGMLDLDTDISNYLTSWSVPNREVADGKPITLRQLLTHTAGFNVHGFSGYPHREGTPLLSTTDVLLGKGNSPAIELQSVPGEAWSYSGGGYVIIQQIIEDVTGKSFAAYMDEEILPHLNMKHSTFSQPLVVPESYLAPSHAFHGDGSVYESLYHDYPEVAPAGLWTTETDLLNYCIEVHRILTDYYRRPTFLSKASIEAMLTPHGEETWGLGPALSYRGDTLLMQHAGKNAGFSNVFVADPYNGNAVVILSNSDRGRILMGELLRSISDQYNLGYAQSKPIERYPMSDEEFAHLTGKYTMEGSDYSITLELDGDRVMVVDANDNTEETLIPVSEDAFMDLEDGDRMTFPNGLEGGEFLWNDQYRFVKSEE